MKALFVFVLPILLLASVYAQDVEYYAPSEAGVYEETVTQQDDSIFKFAWDVPHYGYEYSIARQSGWLDPSAAGVALVAYTRGRDQDNNDNYVFSGYLAIRPFLLDFQSFSLAFGASYFGAIQRFEISDQADVVNSGGLAIDTLAQDIESNLNYQSFNFSVLGSFPEIGFQFVFEIGYLVDNFRTTMDEIDSVADIGGGQNAVIQHDGYHYNQTDHNLYISLELKKIFDRDYFNTFSLLLYSNINLNSDLKKSKAVAQSLLDIDGDGVGDLQIDPPQSLDNLQNTGFFGNAANNIDPQENGEPMDPSYMGAFLTTRVINLPVATEWFGDYSGIGLDSVLGIEYGYGEIFGADIHGAALQAGGSVSFFNFVSLTFIKIWHQRNDFDDEWSLTVSVGLYGPLTPNASQLGTSGVSIGK